MTELKRILLAEDNPQDVELTLAALDEHNLANEVVVVHDGAEALEYLCRRGKYAGRNGSNPVVVLLDLKMPKVDGLEVLRTIKSDEHMKTIPVVMLTSSREEQDLVKSYRLGVNAYVVKPVDFQQFIDAVKELGAFWALINEPPVGSLKMTEGATHRATQPASHRAN
jgi:two-component system response regulator